MFYICTGPVLVWQGLNLLYQYRSMKSPKTVCYVRCHRSWFLFCQPYQPYEMEGGFCPWLRNCMIPQIPKSFRVSTFSSFLITNLIEKSKNKNIQNSIVPHLLRRVAIFSILVNIELPYLMLSC